LPILIYTPHASLPHGVRKAKLVGVAMGEFSALWSIVKLQFCRWWSGIHCQRWTWGQSKWAWDFT